MKPEHIEYGKEYLDEHLNPVIAAGDHEDAIVGMVYSYFAQQWEPKFFTYADLEKWQEMPTSFSNEIYIGWRSNGKCSVLTAREVRIWGKGYVAIKRITVSANKGEFDYPEEKGD